MAAPADDGVRAAGADDGARAVGADDAGQPALPAWLVVAVVLGLTALLSVWAGFLAPERIGRVLVPVWLVPLAVMLGLARAASRRVGLWGALGPALVWVALSWAGLGVQRPEGDLVLPGTGWAYVYLLTGFVLWLVVVALASAPRRRPAQPQDRAGR